MATRLKGRYIKGVSLENLSYTRSQRLEFAGFEVLAHPEKNRSKKLIPKSNKKYTFIGFYKI